MRSRGALVFRASALTQFVRCILVCDHHDVNQPLMSMVCNEDYIVLVKREVHSHRCTLSIVKRLDGTDHSFEYADGYLVSVGFLHRTSIFLLSQYTCYAYALDPFDQRESFPLALDHDSQRQGITVGTVFDEYLYQVHSNGEAFRWTLSVVNCLTGEPIYVRDLTQDKPDIRHVQHIVRDAASIALLVTLVDSHCVVLFYSTTGPSFMEPASCVPLSNAEKPLSICPVFIHSIRTHVLFANDPAARRIHLLTRDRYLQSWPLVAHALGYIHETHELLFITDDDVRSIDLSRRQSFFSILFAKIESRL
jgi:hypothetical protein